MSHTDLWLQNPNPFGSVALAALAAAAPVLVFFALLTLLRVRGHLAGLITALTALVVAVGVFGMPPALAVLSGVYGALYGLFPIGWIVVAAVFLYQITVHTGLFAVIRDSIASVTDDRRLQALIIAFSFGAFLEGAAGFGTPVAISGAMLVGLGFRPLYAASICLIANTVPVAFAALGIPVLAAGEVTGLSPVAIARVIANQLLLLSFIVPAWLVFVMAGWRGVMEVAPAVVLSGATFAGIQWWTAHQLGPYLPAILASLGSLAALVLLLRVWRPRTAWRFPEEPPATYHAGRWTQSQLVRAWTPFLLLTLLIALWSIRPVARLLETVTVQIPFPGLHEAFMAAGAEAPSAVIFKLNWLSAAGTPIFLAAVITLALQRVPPAKSARLFVETLRTLAFPLITIMAVLAFAFIANYSGMSTAMAMALTETGSLYPFLSPVLGWIGVFITGSDTSANALFGNLQASAAREIGMDPVLAVAANTTGGVTGKMISPQSIAVATAAVGLAGRESEILRRTVGHSLAFLLAISVLTYLQASLLPGLAALVPLFPTAWPLGAGGWLVLAGLGFWRRK